MCGAKQSFDTTIPDKYQSNYVRFIGMISNLSKDLSIQALCPECAGIVGQFIKENRNRLNNNKKENRVSTIR
jgi:hypothetical protein